MANNIEKYRRARKMSMKELGDAIGVDASRINKIEKGQISINAERLQRIAQTLQVGVEDLLADAPDLPANGTKLSLGDSSESHRIPVLGMAAGALLKGAFLLTDKAIEWIDPPKILEAARGIYGVYIVGESMEPMFRHGSKILVSEYRPPRVGDAVIVNERESNDGPLLRSLGILRTRSGEKIVIAKLNPQANVEIPAKRVESVHKVLEYAELIG